VSLGIFGTFPLQEGTIKYNNLAIKIYSFALLVLNIIIKILLLNLDGVTCACFAAKAHAEEENELINERYPLYNDTLLDLP